MKNNFMLSIVFLLFCCFGIHAQVTIAPAMTPQQYVENVLIGGGVQVSNITFNNLPDYTGNQIGKFNYVGNQIPFSAGLVLSSGAVSGLRGPNNSTSSTVDINGTWLQNDPELNDIAGFSTYNVGKLEFDFIPAGNTISFNYLFGSEEYNEYVCATKNDVFGFFVTALTPAGGTYNNTNLALIPNTAVPISINTVNNGTVGNNGNAPNCSNIDPNWQANSIYYAGAPGNHFQADGMTVLMNITFNVVCGEPYHFKFAIADGSDEVYDSWVLLKSGSFSSPAVNVSVATASGDSTIIEGCSNASFIFTRPESLVSDTLTINYTVAGTATQGTDFNTLINPIVFLPGQDTVILTLTPSQDSATEDPETAIITVSLVNQCGDTIVSSGTILILDRPEISILENDPVAVCSNNSIQMTAVASGGKPPYTYTWSNGQTGSPAYGAVSVNGPTNYIVTVTDDCGFQVQDTVTITLNQTLSIDTLIQYPSEFCAPTGNVEGHVSGFSGLPVWSWSGPGPNSPNQTNASTFQNLAPGWYYFTVADNVCTLNDSIQVLQKPAPVASFTASETTGCAPLTVSFTNTSQNASLYNWSFGNIQSFNINDLSSQSFTFNDDATVQLIARGGQCSDTTTLTIDILKCGCTDPNAFNYDPTAEVNNGICLYPVPTVEVPNIFTPDGDNANELFFLNTTNATHVQFWIFNRWGNIMYEGNGINPTWDGKINGTLAMDGTYFLKYKVNGLNNQLIEGHGFVQLVTK